MTVAGIITPEFSYQSKAASQYEEGHLARCFGDEAKAGFVANGIALTSRLTFGSTPS